MQLGSPAIDPDGPIPIEYTKDGHNISPPLEWSGVPVGTKELALLLEDVTGSLADAPFAHWVVYGIDPHGSRLPEGFKHMAEPEGRQSCGRA